MVAMSLDGYIAGPNDDFDWITMDPDIDFGSMIAQFDTALVGRRTYEILIASDNTYVLKNLETIVVSNTLNGNEHQDVTIIGEHWEQSIASLRQEQGKDIWLFGGGILFQSMLNSELVDTVEVAVIPILLGGGVQMAPPTFPAAKLKMTNHTIYSKTGTIQLEYDIAQP